MGDGFNPTFFLRSIPCGSLLLTSCSASSRTATDGCLNAATISPLSMGVSLIMSTSDRLSAGSFLGRPLLFDLFIQIIVPVTRFSDNTLKRGLLYKRYVIKCVHRDMNQEICHESCESPGIDDATGQQILDGCEAWPAKLHSKETGYQGLSRTSAFLLLDRCAGARFREGY